VPEVAQTAAEVMDTAETLDKSATPVPEVAQTAAEVMDTAETLDKSDTEGDGKDKTLLTEPAKTSEPTESQKVTEMVDESTAHKKPDEEMITEPAPQTAPSPVNGKTMPESEAPTSQDKSKASESGAPDIVVSSEQEDGEEAPTVEVVKPTPESGATNEAENTPEGIRQRRREQSQGRPISSGSDTMSKRTHRNIMNTFLNVLLFGWLGGVGRFFGGMFGSKKRNEA